MIGKLLDTTVKTVIDSISVYLVSLVLLVGLSTVLVHILGMVGVVTVTGTILTGTSPVLTMIGTGFILVLSALMLIEKKLTNDLLSILMVGVGVWLAMTSSVLLGLVPVALLTTIKSDVK